MTFIAEQVSDEETLSKIYRLRYRVYCEEWAFEKPKDHPHGVEKDEFDKNALHFASKNSEGKIIGTIRLILDSSEGFPLEKYCQVNPDKNQIPGERLTEISRLAISKEYRSRLEDKYLYGPDEERRSIGNFNYSGNIFNTKKERRYKYGSPQSKGVSYERRKGQEVVISLYKSLYLESKKRKITHWYAVMTKGLYIFLSRLGIKFQPIGDPVDYHGIRTPYLGEIEKIEHDVSEKNPELYDEFTKDLNNL